MYRSFEKTKNKQKEARDGPFKNKMVVTCWNLVGYSPTSDHHFAKWWWVGILLPAFARLARQRLPRWSAYFSLAANADNRSRSLLKCLGKRNLFVNSYLWSFFHRIFVCGQRPKYLVITWVVLVVVVLLDIYSVTWKVSISQQSL